MRWTVYFAVAIFSHVQRLIEDMNQRRGSILLITGTIE